MVILRDLPPIAPHSDGSGEGRALFFIHGGQMVLLHGFIKKTQQTPDQDLDLAVKRKKEIENDGKTKE